MSGVLNVFTGSAFNVMELTDAINKVPYIPAFLGDIGLFQEQGITTKNAMIEERQGVLSLVPFSARLARTNVTPKPYVREARPFAVPHAQLDDAVFAEDVQDVRAFGTENQTETIAQLVTEKLTVARQSLEATEEFWRIGAIQGQLLDADGSTVVYDWFDEFGVTEKEVTFDLTSSSYNFKTGTSEVIRHIQDSLGATPYSYILALCGDQWFDEFVTNPSVEEAYQRWMNGTNGGAFFRSTQVRAGMNNGGQGSRVPMFEFQGIMWANYRGFIGTQSYIPTNTARFFPVGAPSVFKTYYAPAPFPETVNTMGQPTYARQTMMQSGLGVDLHIEKNALCICQRPGCLVKGINGGSGS